MDAMKDFITSVALRYYDSPKLEVNSSNSSNSALENFISDAQCLTLSALALNEKIQYQTEVSKGENASLIFYKSIPVTLENENAFQFVGITALPSNPVESLYLTLHHVYGPLLQSDMSITVDPKIQEMLSHLEAGLRTIASGKDGGPSLMVVLTVDDEADYWQTIFAESKTRKQRDMAEAFISILQPLAQEIRSIDIITTSEIQEAMESAGGFLDDLWRHSNYIYPQKRMAHLMDVIGNACITKLQKILTPLDIWGTDSTVIKILTECSSAASAWLSACYSLTQKYWPNHSLHAWEGQSHVPRYLNMFQERLKEIVDVRSIHLQLTKLLSASEQDDLKASKIFQPFHGLNVWQCTPKSNSNWLKSKSHFERLLKPAEDRIAEKLRPKLVSSSAKQMLHEFGRYMALIERPTVHTALKKEREIFMSALGTMLKEIETQVLEDKAPIDNEFNTQELSPLVQQIQWTKYMMGRVSEIEKTTDHLLNDLEGCALIKKQSLNLQNELRQMQTQLYEDWTRDLQMELNNKSLILSAESPVVEFSTDNNLMRVTFNPRLVSLERDVRHMSALGFGIPSAVREAVNHAAQFIGHARALQQVAAFHNTQGDRMIVSQRPMMLQAAIQLAALVKEQSAVPWKNIEAVSKYVEKLKDAESKLVEQNTYLTSQHNAMRNIVLTLMDTDLLQKQSEWKKKIREMRDIIEKVEARGFTNNRAWKIHWDIQLYKALEHQYRSTLINPLPHLPVVRVELLFRHQEVQLQPPLEELRANSYSQLRKLVSLPLHFIGLQSSPTDTESIFASIVKRNNRLIGGALEEVEKTLKTVVTSVQRWRKWGALGTVDLDSLCDIHLSDSADWDRNFKDCKAFGQAIAKLPMEDERVEWIWISSASLRSELEAHNRRYWFALTTSLQTSVQRDTNTLETFIMSANKALTQIVPKNAKELATANEEFRDLKEKEPKMTTLLEGLCKKQSMVRAWGGERTRPLEYLTKQWDNLTSHMQNHEQLIIHQAESVKSSLLGEWGNLNETVEVWHSRWTQNKPRTDQFSDVTMLQLRHSYQLLADATHNWNTFKENKESMINECNKFSLELDEKSLWTDIENKMSDDGKFWEPFTQFDEDLSSLSSQEWFLFQKKLHLLDDLVSDWSQKLEPYTAITLFIQKEINQYKEIVPSLKHLRGADFTERHWREIFSLLDIPPKPADTLILGDFLNVAGNIKINAKMLQKIWTSASHEAVVRGAIAELELWLAGARLLIVKHRDTKGQEVPIIKDYKDILAKVEEYQSLAGSARMAGGDSGGINGDASGGGAGSDQLSIWETRLTYLHSSLTSLAHVQRNRLKCVNKLLTKGDAMRASGSQRLLLPIVFLILFETGCSAQGDRTPPPGKKPYIHKKIHPCEHSSCYPATGNLLIGRESKISASSTCGLEAPETYCIVSHLDHGGKKCFRCSTRRQTENQPSLNHRPSNIIYRYSPGTRQKSWWQSQNGVENVTLQLDLEAEFHFTHLIIVFKTFRPAAMLIERSFDFGETWRVYRYFAHNCDKSFPGVPKHSPRVLTDVVCESRYSQVAPSTDGEVIFRVLPPNINVDNPYSIEVQNQLKITNLRINFTGLHTLGDDLLDDRAEIKEKYYYAISEMAVRGSCSCYGHASRCLPLPGVESKTDMVHGRCECTHNTKGLNCEKCEDFFNDLPWKPALGKTTNACKRCTCNNHATTCHFDHAVYDLTGKVSGGVCDDCQHNTEGRNCEVCKPFYYRDPRLNIQDPEICKPCDCDPRGSLDAAICDSVYDATDLRESGRCHCKINVDGRRCDMCKNGYWDFDEKNPDGCKECTCNALGTVDKQGCDVYTGECTCKRNVIGRDCNQCQDQYYGLSQEEEGCKPCDCDVGGAIDNFCDVVDGQCRCRPNVQGRRCDQPAQHHFSGSLDALIYEAEMSLCDMEADENLIGSGGNCQILTREPFGDGTEETWTGTGFMKVYEDSSLQFIIDDIVTSMDYDIVLRYEPQGAGSWQEVMVHVERPGPVGLDSPCANSILTQDSMRVILRDNARSVTVHPSICLEAGKVYKIKIDTGRQNPNAPNARATVLIDSIVLIPKMMSLPFLNATGPAAEARREEFRRARCEDSYYYDVHKVDLPEICKKFHTSIAFYVFNGAHSCMCDATGSISHQCDEHGGRCPCKKNVVGRRCNRCALGTFDFSPIGCKSCDCSNIGSLDNFCSPSGQCKCRQNTYGRQCDECQPGYWYFPDCQQCECHGHADTCDPKTGACIACRDHTEGHRCERCAEGHYGDPRLGVDIPCRPCPCPGTGESGHSFASRCDLEGSTKEVVCQCDDGYAGSRCDVCADNYFGHPETPGGSCRACDCNGNIDAIRPGNCDPHTGKCLQCLHDTEGDNCEVCKTGFWGDALLKTCKKCVCEILGTNSTAGPCDAKSGQCPCHKNVIGMQCDRCIKNHWKIASGDGCEPCDCDPDGSISEQCNEFDGQCSCRPGLGGRRCDQCETNFWGDPNVECNLCQCDRRGSASQQCLRDTGACVCNPGIGGYNCDECARGFLGVSPSCTACGECFDNWDRIVSGLLNQTNLAIAEAAKIRTVGATGAYTADFATMESKLNDIQDIINSTKVGVVEIGSFDNKVDALKAKFTSDNKTITTYESELADATNSINLAIAALEDLDKNVAKLKNNTQKLEVDATKLQEANLEGALNLTRDAKQRSIDAADDADSSQKLIADSERQIKATELLVERQYLSFNNTQKDNDKLILDLHEKLNELESQIPELNDNMCGHAGGSCDHVCGGAGCGKCGGISCERGAVTKAEQALDFANKTENLIREHERLADDLLRGIAHAKQDTADARAAALAVHDAVFAEKNRTGAIVNDSSTLTKNLKEFLTNTNATPEAVRSLAAQVLSMKINLEPERITKLTQEITDTVAQLTGIESIIEETREDLEAAEDLKNRAAATKADALATLATATDVVGALTEAAIAQKAAEDAINKANEDIEAAKNDLAPIGKKTDEAQRTANGTAAEVEGLKTRLGNLQKDILKIENDAQVVKGEADEVMNVAVDAQQIARDLRQNYQEVEKSLADRMLHSAGAREKARVLLNRATQLASETQMQLKQLQDMEDLYNSHTYALSALEQRIAELNKEVAVHLAEITRKSNWYRSCST